MVAGGEESSERKKEPTATRTPFPLSRPSTAKVPRRPGASRSRDLSTSRRDWSRTVLRRTLSTSHRLAFENWEARDRDPTNLTKRLNRSDEKQSAKISAEQERWPKFEQHSSHLVPSTTGSFAYRLQCEQRWRTTHARACQVERSEVSQGTNGKDVRDSLNSRSFDERFEICGHVSAFDEPTQ